MSVTLPCFFMLVIISASSGRQPLVATGSNSSQNWRPPDGFTTTKSVVQKRFLPATDIKTSICVPVKESICKTSLYNHTYFPNEWDHATQAEAATQLKRFQWILKSKCSPLLPIFLCIFYFPVCSENTQIFPYTEILVMSRLPCTEMCESVRDECSSWLDKNGFDWPTAFSCDKLPPRDGEQECFFPVSNALTLQASKQAFKNMAEAGIVPPQLTSSHFGNPEKFMESTLDVSMKEQNYPNEFGVDEPTISLALLVSISVFISLLVLLSVSIALVRCYFQVCTGTNCSRPIRHSLRRSGESAEKPACYCCGYLITGDTFSNHTSMAHHHDKSKSQDVQANSESSLRKKRTWQAMDADDQQSKSLSIYEVEDSALLANSNKNDASRNYNNLADHHHTLPCRSSSMMTSSHSQYANDRRNPLPPPQSFSLGEGFGQPPARRPSVSWKRSSEEVDQGDMTVKSGNVMITSRSMTFDKTPSEMLPDNFNTLPLSPRNRSKLRHTTQLPLSRSQPDLEKTPPVWLHRHGFEQRTVFQPAPAIRRNRVPTATIGVGTSPSLGARKPPPVTAEKVNSVIERTLVSINYNKAGTAASAASNSTTTSTSTTVLPTQNNRQSRPVTKGLNNFVSVSETGCPNNANSNDNNNSNNIVPANNNGTLKRSVTPTKYSITLFLDDATRINNAASAATVAAVKAQTASTQDSSVIKPGPPVPNKPLPALPIVKEMKKNTAPPPPSNAVNETEHQRQSQLINARELFYV